MNRDEMIEQIEDFSGEWDFIVIGGGATGAGVALEAASRGYRTLLLEQSDFGKGTSSRSTKLIHGGVRYLQQGNISLVLEALKERAVLAKNAPHLVHNLSFIVPNYDWWEGPFYGIGLKLYDLLAGRAGFGKSKFLSREKTIEMIPNIETKGLDGGIIYHDGQFDDARMVINILQTAEEQGATVVNYMPVISLLKKSDLVSGVIARDEESGKEYEIKGKVVVNACGPFTDSIRKMDDPQIRPIIQPSQGTHIVLNRDFLAGDSAIMVPHTSDGRVIFAIPWNNRVLLGTTDTKIEKVELEPRPREDEIEFLLNQISPYLSRDPKKEDILSAFTGIRPLVAEEDESNTASLSREHTISISRSGLVTIAGGKWTTYRKMAQDTVDQAALIAGLTTRPSVSENLNIHGYYHYSEKFSELAHYGSDALQIQKMIEDEPKLGKRLCEDPLIYVAEVIYAAQFEMARTVEDILSRRTRLLLLDVKKSIELAPEIAAILAKTIGKSRKWQKQQIADFTTLAQNYLVI